MSAKRILLSGGNGYVGHRVANLLMRDFEVCIADSLRYGGWRFSAEEQTQIRLEQIDIRESGHVADLMADWSPEIVIHLAALHFIPECERDPASAVSTNVGGTLNLLQSTPVGSRFVFASSGAVYKPQEHEHCEATSEVAPTDIYGLTKLHGEQYVTAMVAKYGLKGVIVRLFNVVGPGETNPHLLPELVAQLKAGRRTIELGNLSPQRDYIDVRDAAAGFVSAALGGVVKYGETCVVNLGTSCTYSVSEVADKLRDVSGIDFEIKQKTDRIRSIDRPRLAADNRLMRQLFDWRQRYTLDDALSALWADPDLPTGMVEKYQ